MSTTHAVTRAIATEIDVRGPEGELVARYRIVDDGDYRIGRDRANAHLLISDTSVSRRHALVRRKGGQLWLADAGSLNGTRLDTDEATAPIGAKALVFRQWPEGVTAGIGIFTLRWHSVNVPDALSTDAVSQMQPDERPVFSRAFWQTWLLDCAAILPVSLLVGLAMGGWKHIEEAPLVLGLMIVAVGLVLQPVYWRLPRLEAFAGRAGSIVLSALGLMLECAVALVLARADILPGVDACDLARIDRLTRQLICVDYALPLFVALVQIAAILVLATCVRCAIDRRRALRLQHAFAARPPTEV